MVSTPTPSSLVFVSSSSTELAGSPPEMVPLPPVVPPSLLALNELRCPETRLLFVKALLLATRRMMSNGAMTCLIRRYIRRARLWESTDLSLREDDQEDTINGVVDAPGSNNQQRAHGVKGTRLNEHGDNSLTQSANSGYPQGISSVPCVDNKPDDDHEGEEDVE